MKIPLAQKLSNINRPCKPEISYAGELTILIHLNPGDTLDAQYPDHDDIGYRFI